MCHAYHTRHAYVMAVATRSCMCHGEPPVQTKQGTTGSNPIGHTRSRIKGVRSPQDSVCHVTTYSAAHRCSIKRMCRMTLRYSPCGVVARRRKVSELKGITLAVEVNKTGSSVSLTPSNHLWMSPISHCVYCGSEGFQSRTSTQVFNILEATFYGKCNAFKMENWQTRKQIY